MLDLSEYNRTASRVLAYALSLLVWPCLLRAAEAPVKTLDIGAQAPKFRLEARWVNHDPPLLFDLSKDIGERHDIATRFPEVVKELQRKAEAFRRELPPSSDRKARKLR